MGRILFVRVSAETYDEAEVARTWPGLCALAWPEFKGAGVPAPSTGKKWATATNPGRRALDLVSTLVEQARFADAGEASIPKDAALRLERLNDQLEAALGDRDVPRAHRLTVEIEDALDDTEKMLAC
jgi:hypothetical protein